MSRLFGFTEITNLYRQASDYLRNAKMEISELATSLSLLKDLSNYVNPSYAMMNDDLVSL